MNEKVKPVVVSITFGDQASAVKLGKEMVEMKLVACAQLFPILSIYNWKDEVQSDNEFFMQAKTVASKIEQIEQFIVEHHTYDVPEIIVTPIIWGHAPYLEWVVGETGEGG